MWIHHTDVSIERTSPPRRLCKVLLLRFVKITTQFCDCIPHLITTVVPRLLLDLLSHQIRQQNQLQQVHLCEFYHSMIESRCASTFSKASNSLTLPQEKGKRNYSVCLHILWLKSRLMVRIEQPCVLCSTRAAIMHGRM